MIAPAVAFAWEVDPLRVAELIAHEREVTLNGVLQSERNGKKYLASQRQGNEAHHLVQGHASRNHQRLLGKSAHISVDLSVKEPH